MTSAWEWPAAFSVKHPDSSVLDCSSHSSAVRRWYDSSTPASQGQLLELGSTPPCFTLLFKLCVSDGAIQQKKEWWGPDWDVRNEMKGWSARTDWNRMKGRYEGGWRVEALERGGPLSYSRSVIETISCACMCVCVLCVHQSVKGLGQRPRSFTKHGHITETQWKFPRATTAHFHGVDVAAQLHSCTGWKSPPACRVHTGETHLRDTKTHCLSSPNSTQLPSHYRAREVCAVFVGVSAVFIERLVPQESHGLSSVFTVCQLCL